MIKLAFSITVELASGGTETPSETPYNLQKYIFSVDYYYCDSTIHQI